MTKIYLKPKREKAILRHHPWIFSGAVKRIDDDARDGDIVTIYDAGGGFLARGYLNRQSQIVVRLLSWNRDEPIDRDFWRRRLQAAIARRASFTDERTPNSASTNAYRLVHAESDLLPGLVVDRYANYLVMQCLTLGIAQRKGELAELLMELTAPRGIYERSDVDVRAREGLSAETGTLLGDTPPETIEILENGYRFAVDIQRGQKTGFYLDQRDNRRILAQYCNDAEVLNCFAYTGGFSVYAAAHAARSIVNIDSSADALDTARNNMTLNGLTETPAEYVTGDVFQVLREYRAAGRRFDVIILDPPKFAHTQRQVKRATRGYKDINLLAMQLLRPDGILGTFSCSGVISADLFQKVVFGASVDAHRDAQILARLTQGFDHPVLLSFPEGDYLKGLLCRMVL